MAAPLLTVLARHFLLVLASEGTEPSRRIVKPYSAVHTALSTHE